MTDNSYITSLIQYLKAETTLAGEQAQNGSSTEAKNEAQIAFYYMNALRDQIEHDREHGFFDSSRYNYSCSYEGRGQNDND